MHANLRRRGSIDRLPGPTAALRAASFGAAALFVAAALLVAACTAGAGPTPPPSATVSPSAPPASGPPGSTLEHPDGPTEVVLRFEESGGLMPPGFLATTAPIFTLYGDGSAIFRDPAATVDEASATKPAGVYLMAPFRIARLPEQAVQSLLAWAIGPGGLGAARAGHYDTPGVADAPTSTFELHAGGLDKRVEVYALGIEGVQVGEGDQEVRRSLASLRERLLAFDAAGATSVTIWRPERYRATLVAGTPAEGIEPLAWPWPTIGPADFVPPAEPGLPSWPRRVLTAEEVSRLGVRPFEGGFTGLWLRAPDGTRHALTVRPLLPDEAA